MDDLAHVSVAVLGVGAVGSVTSAYLARGGIDVAAFDPWHQHVEETRSNGLRIAAPEEDFVVRVRIDHLDALSRVARPIDVLFLALKSYDTEWAVRYAAPYLAPDGVIVSLQNGMNEPAIAAIVGRERTMGCVVHLTAELRGPGSAVASTGPSWSAYTVGELDGARTERVERIAAALSTVGTTKVTERIGAALWAKLTTNTMTNGLASITGLTTRQLWADERVVPVLLRIAGETIEVAYACDEAVDPIKPPGAVDPLLPTDIRAAYRGDAAARARLTSALRSLAASRSGRRENRSSMLQDVLRGRRPEIDQLNGHVVREGAARGVPTPVNAALVSLVHEVAAKRRELGPANVELLPAAAASVPVVPSSGLV
ncbi:MAG: 2-dehydropantoate 2-reductase [Chloroflexota bacterium]|nr:2-dehydropantoate 2-reductase [Chloroflexota bacterium]